MKPLSNVRRRMSPKSVATILPAVLLPLLAVGFSVEPVLRLSNIRSESAELRAELGLSPTQLPVPRSTVVEFDREAGLELAQQLRALVPLEIESVDVYGASRLAAEDAGLALTSIQLGPDTPVDGVTSSIASRGLSLMGRGDAERLPELVRRLRSLGFPCQVLSLNVASRGTGVDFQLGLGLFHRSPTFENEGQDLE